MNGTVVAYTEENMMNSIAFGVVLLFGIYLVAIVANPLFVPTKRRPLSLLWIFVIVFAHNILIDNPEQYSFLKDSMKIIGAMLVITWPMKLLTTKEAEQAKMMQDVEIIEV